MHIEAMRLPFVHRWSKVDLPFTTFFFFFYLPTYLRMYSIGVEHFLLFSLLLHSIQFYELLQFLGEVSIEPLSHFQWFAITGNLVCILSCLCASVPVG